MSNPVISNLVGSVTVIDRKTAGVNYDPTGFRQARRDFAVPNLQRAVHMERPNRWKNKSDFHLSRSRISNHTLKRISGTASVVFTSAELFCQRRLSSRR